MAHNMTSIAPTNESVASLFVQQYCENDRDHYREILKAVVEICDQVLTSQDIHHAIQSRLKDPVSLQGKLAKFERKRGFPYKTIEDIKRDIIDLAGVRILVHVPSDRMKASELLKDAFVVRKAFDHPKDDEAKGGQQKDQGYVATHLHVFLKDRG